MSAGIQRGDIVKEAKYEKALSAIKKDKVLRLLVKHGDSSRFVAVKVE